MTVNEMRETLTRLGIEIESIRGDEIQAHCPAHADRTGKEDRSPSWWINSDSGAHNCFSCGWKGNLYSLVSYVQGIEYETAQDWLGSTAGLMARFNKVTREERPIIEEVTHVTESMLSAFTFPPDEALLSRGLSKDSSFKYGLRWDARNKNWIIPIRSIRDAKLLGWQEKGYDHRYFNNKPTGVAKSTSLFGYELYTGGDLFVVESPLDVVRLSSLGFTGVATYGASVSIAQLHALRGADRLIVAFDNDDAGRLVSIKLIEELNQEAWFFNYSHTEMKDIGGMSLDEIRLGVNNAKHSVHGKRAVL